MLFLLSKYQIMRVFKLSPLLFFFLFLTCRTTPPLISFLVGEGVVQHFLSPTYWTSASSKKSKAMLDVTYRTGEDTPATVNISFYGNKITPRDVRDISLHGMGIECPLEFITTIYSVPDKNELRLSFSADRDKFVDIMRTQQAALTAVVDGITCVYTPEKNFYKLKNKFLAEILY
jgi:hypothetical protein